MTKSEIDLFLGTEKIPMRLGTIDHKRHPQIHPVWYHYANDKLYLMTDTKAKKVQNLKGTNIVYFSVDTDAVPNRGVKGKGTARIVTESKEAVPIVEKLVAKYLGDTKTGMGKGLVDRAREGTELLIEITPHYYSVWDYRKMAK
jgi:nitroimidazol reductase NimA-like FMN-containing flavoprotein (pyridoxamine 5'-phosphate oxidase superfamily)